jgi:hypothetical protein
MEEQNNTQNKIVETYAGDMADVIESDKGDLVKKIIHGEEEHEEERKNLSPESKKNRIFMFIGILLIALALATLSFFIFNKDADTVPVQKQFIPLVFTDQSTQIEISGLKKDEIAQTVLSGVSNTKVKAGGVEGIYLTENAQSVGLRRFITLISGSFVPGDDTTLVNDNFLMGDVNSQAGPASAEAVAGGDFFMLLKVRSTADIFDSLRAWEGKMFSDLHGFLGINISSDTNYLLTKNFEDGIVENKNARILYDNNGGIVLMYIFADDNSVVITGSQPAAHEIMLRLASSQVK